MLHPLGNDRCFEFDDPREPHSPSNKWVLYRTRCSTASRNYGLTRAVHDEHDESGLPTELSGGPRREFRSNFLTRPSGALATVNHRPTTAARGHIAQY